MDEYQILQQVGKGTFGSVYKVKDLKDGEILAIKQVICSDLKAANQAISEIFNIHNLRHENLIDYKKLFLTSTNNNLQLCVNVVMPFYSKGDLEGYIGNMYKSGLRLNENEIIDYSLQILACMSYLHQNFVMHRDLKPANVFITQENMKTSLKIGDFGLSTKVGMENFKTSVVGTQAYCAPEVFRQMYSFSVDMFSFGAILYKMLTGKERVFFMELYQNPNCLKEMKQEIEKNYDSFWFDLVLILLDVTPEKRPSAEKTKQMILTYTSNNSKDKKKLDSFDLPPLPKVSNSSPNLTNLSNSPQTQTQSDSFKNQQNAILQHLETQHKKSSLEYQKTTDGSNNSNYTQMLPPVTTKPLNNNNSQPLLQLDSGTGNNLINNNNTISNGGGGGSNTSIVKNGSGNNQFNPLLYPQPQQQQHQQQQHQQQQHQQPYNNPNNPYTQQQVLYYQKQQQQLQQQYGGGGGGGGGVYQQPYPQQSPQKPKYQQPTLSQQYGQYNQQQK
eukprot:gene10420-2947_t